MGFRHLKSLRSYDGLKSQDLGIFFSNFAFFGKTTLYGKISKILVPKVFTASPIDVVVFKCRKNFSDGKSAKPCVIRMTEKNRLPLKLSLLRDRARSMPGPAPNIWLTMFKISSKSVRFQRSYSRMREGHFPIEYFLYSPECLRASNETNAAVLKRPCCQKNT